METAKRYFVSHISRLRMASDGEGIRTLILLEGCPLRCRFCINPQTWNSERGAYKLTAAELYDRISKDRLYMRATNGGVTFGGGEPLMQPELIKEFRDLLERQLTIYAETSLHVPWENIETAADCVDRFYVDIKTCDPDIYREYTGSDIEPVLENLKALMDLKGCDSILARVPVIPDFADERSQAETKACLESIGVRHFDFFEYVVRWQK